MHFDWGDGRYETTAVQLDEASRDAIEVLGVTRRDRVLDVGCGTGNAALHAARRGAEVAAVDPTARFLEVVGRRAGDEGLQVRVEEASAEAMPFADASFDVLVAIFSVIFAPEPAPVVAEMRRVLRRDGRMAITTWKPEGAVHEVTELMIREAEGVETRALSPWEDLAALGALFDEATLEVHDRRITFSAPSAEAWFADLEINHPAWRAAKASLAPETWSRLRKDMVQLLDSRNESTDGFTVSSGYQLLLVR